MWARTIQLWLKVWIPFICLCVCSVAQSVSTVAFPPQNGQAYYNDYQLTVLPQTAGITYQMNWSDIETSQGTYVWNVADAPWQALYALGGITISSATCSTGTVTANIAYSIAGSQPLFAVGASVGVANLNSGWNGTFTIAGVTGHTQVTYAQSCPGGSSGSGNIYNLCKGNLPCKLNPVLSHITTGNHNVATPAYVTTQAWSDTAFGIQAWTNGATYLNNGNTEVFLAPNYYKLSSTGSCKANGTSVLTDLGCSWTLLGLHSNPQYVAFSNTFFGTNNGGTVPMNVGTSSVTQGMYNISMAGVVAATLNTGFHDFSETPYQLAWANVSAQFVARYDHGTGAGSAPWAAQILYFRNNLMRGGENNVIPSAVMQNFFVPATQAQFSSVVNSSILFSIKNNATNRALNSGAAGNIVTLTGSNAIQTCTMADQNASDAFSNGQSIGTQGFQLNDITHFAVGPVCTNFPPPGCAGDWCQNFTTFLTPYAELQTTTQTCPTLAIDCPSNTVTTGSLSVLAPFAAARTLNGTSIPAYEIYFGDWLCTYDPAYIGPPTYAECQAAGYPAAFAALNATLTGWQVQHSTSGTLTIQ